MSEDHPIPKLLQSDEEGLDLATWGRAQRDFILRELEGAGALLFRGFKIDGVQAFEAFMQLASSHGLIDYSFRSTPRQVVAGKIYTSTEYPADQHIPLHNEMSYTRAYPSMISFFCMKAAPKGGATPIADSSRIYDRIKPAVRDKFARHGVAYVRNYRQGIDLPYEEVFGSSNREDIERFCGDAGIEVEFNNGGVRTRQVCQAIIRHPRTGRPVWFNQAHLFHVSSLDPAIASALVDLYGAEGLPRNCFYGDGSEIDPADLDHVREAYDQEKIAFPWHEGDVLMLDNLWVAHGREPFAGERKVVVAMADPLSSPSPHPQ